QGACSSAQPNTTRREVHPRARITDCCIHAASPTGRRFTQSMSSACTIRCSACERTSKDLGEDATLPLILRRLPTMDIAASRTPRAGGARIGPHGLELARCIQHKKVQSRVGRRLEMLLLPVGKVQQLARLQRERLSARRGSAVSTLDV